MKINIAASHRFHLLDLARELEKQGHDVRFYSYVPKSRCVKFGLSRKASKSLLLLVAPFFALQKLFPKSTSIIKYRNLLLDFYVANFTRNCDVFIGLGIVYYKSFKKLKRAKTFTILEWGSKHILKQQEILKKINAPLNPHYFNKIALENYKDVDYIAIASEHVKQSFLDMGISTSKLFVNPYGVDLSMFYPDFKVEKRYDVIMVGGWSLRKGCDIIIESIKEHKVSFLHVGKIVDLGFPNDPLFTHIDAVDQKDLVKYYNQSKVFVLPSREEGLAMVQMQAVSCNLPLICSKNSGGEDLTKYFGNSQAISVLSDITSVELSKEINAMLKYVASHQSDTLYYDMNGKNQLTWEAYGKRYNDFLHHVL